MNWIAWAVLAVAVFVALMTKDLQIRVVVGDSEQINWHVSRIVP
jgi:hypothetical protein